MHLGEEWAYPRISTVCFGGIWDICFDVPFEISLADELAKRIEGRHMNFCMIFTSRTSFWSKCHLQMWSVSKSKEDGFLKWTTHSCGKKPLKSNAPKFNTNPFAFQFGRVSSSLKAVNTERWPPAESPPININGTPYPRSA